MDKALLQDCMIIGTGAVFGACLRHSCSKFQNTKGVSPWGICVVNIAGSFMLGCVSVAALDPRAQLLLGTGTI